MALSDSLVAYWKLDEESGARADALGTHDLADNNTVGYTAGKQGNAADFVAASNEYLSKADHADYSFGDEDFTVALWLKLDVKAALRTVFGKNQVGAMEYILYYDNGVDRLKWRVSADDAASVAATVIASTLGSPTAGTWYFIVAWHDATADTVCIQVDGGTVDSVAYSGGCHDSSATLAIGANGNGQYFWDGAADEVGLWSRVLTAAERTALYNGGDGLTYPFWSGYSQAIVVA